MREYLTRKIYGGVVFALAIFGTTILAVSISGTIKTWTTGEVLKSADLNTTIASLQTAIQNIPNWTKAANGTDAYFTAGNVGIGTASPLRTLHLESGDGVEQIIKNNGTTSGSQTWGVQAYQGNLNFRTLNDGATAETGVGSVIKLTRAGNVGIGLGTTTSPTSRLHISSSNFDLLRMENFTTGNAWAFGIGDSGVLPGKMTVGYYGAAGGGIAGGNYYNIIAMDKATGFVGIGTTSPTQMLTVNGNAGNTTGVWVNNSDERLKKNIQPLGSFLEKLTELRPVTFEWKDPKKLNAKEGKHIGFIAQEVEKVFPYWVDTDKDGMKWLSMEGVNAAFVQSFKEVALRLRSGSDSIRQVSDRVSVMSDSVSVVTQKIDSLYKEKAANEKKLLALEESNQKLIEDNKRLREIVETHGRASLRLEDRLRAIETLQMARK